MDAKKTIREKIAVLVTYDACYEEGDRDRAVQTILKMPEQGYIAVGPTHFYSAVEVKKNKKEVKTHRKGERM